MGTTKTLCPFCASPLVTQIPPTSLLDKLASLVSIHPFQCQSCKRRFRMKRQESSIPSGQVERRQSPRVAVEMPVTFENEEGSGEGILTDMSMYGCTLDTKRNLRPGLVLRLYLPAGTDKKPDSTVEQLASVLAIRGTRAGLKFMAYSPQERDTLTQTVTRSMRIYPPKAGGAPTAPR